MLKKEVKTGMKKQKVFQWQWLRPVVLFGLSLLVSTAILLVLPVHQYFSKKGMGSGENKALANANFVKISLEKPPEKKKKLKVETVKPQLVKPRAALDRFALDITTSGSGAVAIAAEDAGQLTYDMTSVDQNPVRLRGREPVAPDMFYAAGGKGEVALEVVIEPDGSVGSVQVISESPVGYGLGQVCADAVRGWVFRPAKVKGIDVRIRVIQPFTF